MKATNNKPISKTRLLTLIKELDWKAVKQALEANPDLKDRDGVTVGSLLSRARTPEYRSLAEDYS